MTFAEHPTIHNFIDLTGARYGRLTVLGYVGRDRDGRSTWACSCECGQQKDVVTNLLRSGRVQSCGCFRRETAALWPTTHGGTGTPEHWAWKRLIQRCTNPNNGQYPNYGGRGIGVCDRWRHSFENFLADMGPRPSPKHSLDRYPNNDGNYEPGNCRWATPREQVNNRRVTKTVTWRGETKPLTEWSEVLGIGYRTLNMRLWKGWSIEKAFGYKPGTVPRGAT